MWQFWTPNAPSRHSFVTKLSTNMSDGDTKLPTWGSLRSKAAWYRNIAPGIHDEGTLEILERMSRECDEEASQIEWEATAHQNIRVAEHTVTSL
jgi:hypothetical protein